jgi:hypothetical protein
MKTKGIADKYIFIVCLVVSIALFVGGFFCPPMGSIDGSLLKAAAILLMFAALGVAAQAIHNGKSVSFSKGDMEMEVGDDDSDENKQ